MHLELYRILLINICRLNSKQIKIKEIREIQQLLILDKSIVKYILKNNLLNKILIIKL